jgi:hypothetical protein
VIIVDLNQVMISNLMAQIGSHHNIPMDESIIRDMVLNAIKGYRKKFFEEFGELVIATDDKHYWRRDVFPYYKAHRKAWRDKSELDWTAIWSALNNIKGEIRDIFPYKFIEASGAEADDIIGALCHKFGKPLNTGEPILILSGDKDFVQLQKYANVKQYNPVLKKFVTSSEPEKFLIEHILKGDRGDGIPNILSKDDCFINSRQKPLRKTFINKVVQENGDVHLESEEHKRNFARNKMLVDLTETPEEIKLNILEQFEKPANGREKLFNYFIEYKLKGLVEHIGEY